MSLPASAPPQPSQLPPPSSASLFVRLVLRLLTLAAMVITMGILASNHFLITIYRYMLSTAIVGAAYSLFQIAFMVSRTAMSTSSTSHDGTLIDFYGDKIVSYLLLSGATGGLAVIRDRDPAADYTYYRKGYASAGFLLLGFICVGLLSVMASFNLPKRVVVQQL